ncbi:uncharacterized protein DS421_16g558520 [Arachis hypogaea]|nr:uncharacterized protein DS421_16g558520 [Arachis hypogaea]
MSMDRAGARDASLLPIPASKFTLCPRPHFPPWGNIAPHASFLAGTQDGDFFRNDVVGKRNGKLDDREVDKRARRGEDHGCDDAVRRESGEKVAAEKLNGFVTSCVAALLGLVVAGSVEKKQKQPAIAASGSDIVVFLLRRLLLAGSVAKPLWCGCAEAPNSEAAPPLNRLLLLLLCVAYSGSSYAHCFELINSDK